MEESSQTSAPIAGASTVYLSAQKKSNKKVAQNGKTMATANCAY
jgi:hypothetical protein